jgi:hypothetical protein
MAGRYTVSALTGAGSTTLPIISLYASTTVRPRLREFGVFNTTATAVSLKLVRLTTAGTQGTGLTEMPQVFEDVAAVSTAFNTHTVAPTITSGDLLRFVLGAAIGSGAVFTFPDTGIAIPPLANNGLGIVVSTGTGQVCEAYLCWDE